MPPQNDLLDAAERVAALLAENGVRSLVIGAIALAAHRYIRITQDIGLAVEASLSVSSVSSVVNKRSWSALDIISQCVRFVSGGNGQS